MQRSVQVHSVDVAPLLPTAGCFKRWLRMP